MKIYFKIGLIFGLTLMLFSCKREYNKQDIERFLKSFDKTEIIKGCSLLKDKRDTIYVKYLFNDLEDGRISHNAKFYGISVYQAKIEALRRISRISPPNKITYKFDSLNTCFYKKWATDKGLIK